MEFRNILGFLKYLVGLDKNCRSHAALFSIVAVMEKRITEQGQALDIKHHIRIPGFDRWLSYMKMTEPEKASMLGLVSHNVQQDAALVYALKVLRFSRAWDAETQKYDMWCIRHARNWARWNWWHKKHGFQPKYARRAVAEYIAKRRAYMRAQRKVQYATMLVDAQDTLIRLGVK